MGEPEVITRRTVLILGAGASAPYGFPLGRALLLKIVRLIRERHSDLYPVLGACGFQGQHINDFADQLERSMQPSVDLFLESRSQFMDVGKAAIAAALIPYENERNLQQRLGVVSEHSELLWYEYLFGHLAPNRTDYQNRKLSVITFNYDRSFEHFLFLALRASFGVSDEEESKQLLQIVPVVHVYGQLGTLDYMAPDGRPYQPDLSPQAVMRCAKEIKIVHKAKPDTAGFTQAYQFLRSAEAVCFLGFGYHKSNVERLGLHLVQQGAPIYGSAFHMTGSEVDSKKMLFSAAGHRERLYLGTYDQEVLTFLRNHPVIM